MPIIDIHEFSTGINEEGTPENWHSKGFTGSYMNATLMQIPRAVREDIGAGLFELSEQAVQKTPALIGREVQLGDEQWSVLAVISNANDEIGRNISVTRYFLTQGLGKLNDLLTYQQKNNLIFDPFDLRQFNEAHQYDTDETPSNISNLLSLVFGDDYSNFLNNPLIPANTTTTTGQRLPAVAISKLAEEKANRYEPSMLITWAYNVEGLRTPRDFLVIYPANTIIPSEETPTEQNEEHTQPEFSTDSDGENDLTQPIQATPQLLSLPPSNHNLSSPTGNIYSAEQSIQRDLDRDNSGNNNQQRRERENEIYNAIHYWMYYGLREQNSNIFQLNNFCQIASEDSTNLRNSYDANFWEQSIFQALGIDDARGVENQLGTYSDNFVRLYFLYGLILPHKFTEFLTWLSQSSGGINENSEACQNALSFSTQINQQSLRLAN
nr:hypothetical protein [Crocosphaera sp.]